MKTVLENRLPYPHNVLTKAFTTNVSFPPMFTLSTMKTGEIYSVTAQTKVKTDDD